MFLSTGESGPVSENFREADFRVIETFQLCGLSKVINSPSPGVFKKRLEEALERRFAMSGKTYHFMEHVVGYNTICVSGGLVDFVL